MSHEPEIAPETKKNNDETNIESFGEWSNKQVPFLVSKFISILLFIGTFIYYVFHSGETITELISIRQAEELMYYLNLAFCLLCVIKLLLLDTDETEGESSARKVFNHIFRANLSDKSHNQRFKRSTYLLGRFKLYFQWFWIVMFVLYMIFTVKTFTEASEPEGKVVNTVISDTTTMLKIKERDTVVSIRIKKREFIHGKETEQKILAIKKDATRELQEEKQVFYHSAMQALGENWNGWLTYSLNTLSVMFILWCFSITAVGARHPIDYKKKSSLIYLSAFFTALLIAAYPFFIGLLGHRITNETIYYEENLKDYTVFMDAISGVINGLTIGIFISRLDSKLVSLPSRLIGMLYLYSAVQPLFLVFDLPGYVNEAIKVCVLVIVFFLKIYFFFIITYAIEKGKILTYLYCFSTLNDRVESIIKNPYQFRIKHEALHHFSCDIYKGDGIAFKVDGTFASQYECHEEIKKIKYLSLRHSNYSFDTISESQYIIIKDEKDIKHCTSYQYVDSLREGKNLVRECVKKIPYCRVVIL